jgi:hypothetical protein
MGRRMTSLSYNVQWQYWADEWINVGFFDSRDTANAYLDTMSAAWPFHAFRVVWRRKQAAA